MQLSVTRSRGWGAIEVVSLAERKELGEDLPFGAGWPEFIFHDPVADRCFEAMGDRFADLNLVLLDGDTVVAGGWGVPIAWDGTPEDLPEGWDDALERAVRGSDEGREPDTISTMAAEVTAAGRGRGLGGTVLTALRERAERRGLTRMVAPVRPVLKARYPLVPMERYVTWTREDGAPFDPWIRTHHRLGARVLRVAARSMVITGTVMEWETWTGMTFPESGAYVVPGALDLVRIDREGDRGEYVEPNVWMRHR
jgi:GNAT superfamily N-acetyltransferase